MMAKDLKSELQGTQGIISKIRQIYFCNTLEMGELAFKRYEDSLGEKIDRDLVLNKTDEILKNLLLIEAEIFNEKSHQLADNIIPIFYKEIYKNNNYQQFQHMNKIIDDIKISYNKIKDDKISFDEFINEICTLIMPAAKHISISMSQSAKSRAGAALEHHLHRLLSICSFPFEYQQRKSADETVSDFFLPNLKMIEVDCSLTINIECQTTLKDRYRLTQGKNNTERIQKYLATATGCGIFTKNDVNDFTFNKIKEITCVSKTRLLVFENVKKDIINKIEKTLNQNSNSILEKDFSYQDIKELYEKMTNSNLLLSFREFFNRMLPMLKVWEGYDCCKNKHKNTLINYES